MLCNATSIKNVARYVEIFQEFCDDFKEKVNLLVVFCEVQ